MDRPPQEIAAGLATQASTDHRRVRRGRERGIAGPGDRLVPRLGPALPETAPFHNPTDLSSLTGAGSDNGHLPGAATQISDLVFVALDCETTGHFPHRMVELGAVRFRFDPETADPEPRISLESLVHTDDYINPFARRVHGIQRAMLGGAPTLRRVATEFDLLARGAVLVEHSADGFDTRLVSRSLGHPLPNQHLDTSRMAGLLFELRDTIGLERLCEQLEVAHRSPHYALADAEATADCFVRLVQLGREQFGWSNLGDLIEVGMPPIPRIGPRLRPSRADAASAAVPPPAEDPAATGVGSPAVGRRRHRGGRRRHAKGSPDASPPTPSS